MTDSTRDDGVEALYEGMNGWRIPNAKWQTSAYGTKKSTELVSLAQLRGALGAGYKPALLEERSQNVPFSFRFRG